MLGLTVSENVEWAGTVRSSLSLSALEALMDQLGLSASSGAASLAIPERPLTRRKRQARLTADESDGILRLARNAATAIDVVGDRRKASLWLEKPNRALGSATPLSDGHRRRRGKWRLS